MGIFKSVEQSLKAGECVFKGEEDLKSMEDVDMSVEFDMSRTAFRGRNSCQPKVQGDTQEY